MIRLSCKHKGISKYVVNPKSQSYDLLMGKVDGSTLEWKDGILPKVMRQALDSTSGKRKWLVLDGFLEAEWVENLNSVLDDNRKLTLATGESIPLER